MSRKRQKPRHETRPTQPSRPAALQSIARKLLFSSIITVAFFAAAEVLLALAGWTPSANEEDPYVGFSSFAPLFVETEGAGGERELVTANNKLPWFNQQRFARQKKANEFRVFCLRGSTTYGRPYDDATSFAGWLRELLPVIDGSRRWEIINAGGISYASYRVANVMQELCEYEPDLFIVPASNLADCSPFKSDPSDGLPGTARQELFSLLTEAEGEFANGHFDRSLELTGNAVQLDPRYAQAQYLRGQSLLRLQRFEEAVNALQKARDEDVCALRASSEIRDTVARVATDLTLPVVDFDAYAQSASPHGIPGRTLFLDHVHPTIEGHRELALLLVKEMQDTGILSSNASWGAEVVARASQQVMSRVDVAKQAMALKNLSKVLGWAGKEQEADRLALQAIELMPDDAETQYQAGNASMRQGDIDEAIRRYQRSFELNPTSPATQYSLGLAFAAQGDQQQAIKHYQNAVQIEPQFGDAHYNLAMQYEQQNRLDLAASHYRKAISSNPNDHDAHNNLGIIYAKQQNWVEARTYFEQALRLDPNSVDAHLNLGRVFARQGEISLARENFQWILGRIPNHAAALDELKSLD